MLAVLAALTLAQAHGLSPQLPRSTGRLEQRRSFDPADAQDPADSEDPAAGF